MTDRRRPEGRMALPDEETKPTPAQDVELKELYLKRGEEPPDDLTHDQAAQLVADIRSAA